MPYQSVKLNPGLNTTQTPALNELGWSSCQYIRFKENLPQKWGGWTKYYANSLGSPIKEMHPWQDLNGGKYLGVGATLSLQVIPEGELVKNITPQVKTSVLAPDLSTTSGSPTVTVVDTNVDATVYDVVYFETPVQVGGIKLFGAYQVAQDAGGSAYEITGPNNATSTVANGGTLPVFTTINNSSLISVAWEAHGYSAGNSVFYLVPTTVGGLVVVGTYTVVSVTDADNFVISASQLATSSDTQTMNGGDLSLTYYIGVGPSPTGVGWGIGGWGLGGWGTGATSPFVPGTPITATNWTLDNWGEILIACPADGPIYAWRPRSAYTNAAVIPQAPFRNGGVFVAMPQQQLIAWGSSYDNGQQDPLLVRWCSVSDYNDWTATAQNQAGSYRLPRGSKIVGGLQAPQRGLIFTDLALWSMTYIGSELVYGFDEVGTGCGLVGRHAVTLLAGVPYWMSAGNFFMLAGDGIQGVPCPIWDNVFQNINTAFYDNVYAGADSNFNEVIWFYPSNAATTGVPDSYVKYNAKHNVWDFGPLQRNVWIDQSVLGNPIAASEAGYIYQHDEGNDADGVPMQPFIESGWFMITEGDPLAFVDLMRPDFKYGEYPGTGNAQIRVTITTADYAEGPETTHGPFTVSEASTFINLRARGRMMKIRFASQDLGSFWRLGNVQLRIAQAGRR